MVDLIKYLILQLIINKGIGVEVGDFNNDLKGDEVDNGMLDRVLVQQHVQVENLRSDINHNLEE